MQDKQQELGDQIWNYIDARKNENDVNESTTRNQKNIVSPDVAELMMLTDVLFQEFKSDQIASSSQSNARTHLENAIKSERTVLHPNKQGNSRKGRLFSQFRWNRQMALLLILLLLAAFAGGMATWNAYQNYCKSNAPDKQTQNFQRVIKDHCSLLALPQKMRRAPESQRAMLASFPKRSTGHCSNIKENELDEGSTTNHRSSSRSFDAAFTSREPGAVHAGESGVGHQRVSTGL